MKGVKIILWIFAPSVVAVALLNIAIGLTTYGPGYDALGLAELFIGGFGIVIALNL